MTLCVTAGRAVTAIGRAAPARGPFSPARTPRSRLRCRAEASGVVEGAPATAAAITPSQTQLQQARQIAELSLESYRYHKAPEPEAEDVVASLKRKFEAAQRELGSVTEAEFARLANRDASAALAAVPAPLLSVDTLIHTIQQQHTAQPPAIDLQQQSNVVPLPALTRKTLEKEAPQAEGTGEEVLLQGFNWDSCNHPGGWYNYISSRAEELGRMGFTAIWLPPPTQSVSKQGYMPGDLYDLNSAYGTEEDLIGCVRALQAAGLKVLGDAVLNHRCAQHQDEHGVWNKYGGKMAWDARAIVGDDQTFRGRGNRSSGKIFAAAPNIDHSQDFVKRDLQEWLVWLRSHVGFDGFRLDFVTGFAASHVKDYMAAAVPQFAVGEFWDALQYDWDGTPVHNQDAHRQRVVDWINGAGGLSTAFDMTNKGIMHAVFERCEYWRLRDGANKPAGLLGWWPSRAVTFLENHDTGSTQGHWRFPGHAIEQGYAYILTHPGTPCVFWDHLSDQRQKDTVARLVAIRKRNGIHCRSKVTIHRAERDIYTAEVEGKDGRAVLMKIGPGEISPDPAQWVIADCGHSWAVWERKQ
ncbi:hypothetical protein D9Q98_002039 [Chlorella vulgaris]|uniref:alpha-amylase n=1 Tax=Chlorella vulgaris TaxID=3077 RepID=A0A9D4TVX6_CHLVU|nr:hypothetical protein D9Q98_002039 [Chlorella vulgaris]